MASDFNPSEVWIDGLRPNKGAIVTGLGQLVAEVNHAGFAVDPTTGLETTGANAIANVHNDAVKHSDNTDVFSRADAPLEYQDADGWRPVFRYPALTADRTLTFLSGRGRGGTVATVLNRATGTTWDIVVRRQDSSDPDVFTEDRIKPNHLFRIIKNQDGNGDWINLGKPHFNADVVAANSITSTGGLVGDQGNPGINKLYGTDGVGTKGWYDKPGAGAGGEPNLHSTTHAAGGSDPVTLAQSQITGLATLLTSLQNQIDALKLEVIRFPLDVDSNGLVVLDQKASYAYDVENAAVQATNGSVTLAFQVDGSSISGLGALVATTTENTASSTAGQRVALDQTLSVVVSGYDGTPKLVSVTLRARRA